MASRPPRSIASATSLALFRFCWASLSLDGQVLKQLKQAWKRDRLGVLGVGSAVAAALMIVLPAEIFVMGDQIGETPSFNGSISFPIYGPGYSYIEWFSTERLPEAAVFGFVSVILLLLRRR